LKIPNLIIGCDESTDLLGTILCTLTLERNRKELQENTEVALKSLFEIVDGWNEIYYKHLKVKTCQHNRSFAMKKYWDRRRITEEKYRR
jgi:hypothetical protein